MRDWRRSASTPKRSLQGKGLTCHENQGGLCSSLFLDTNFQKCIETLVGRDQYSSIKEINRKKIMKEFEYGIKRTFSEKSIKNQIS